MKNKFITITIIISSVVLIVALIFVLIGLNNNESNIVDKDTNNEDSINDSNSNLLNNKYENILVSSKVGKDIIDIVSVSNVYSKAFVNELQINGLNDKAKRIFAYMKITKDEKYANVHKTSDEYTGYYFTSSDLQAVVNEYFYDSDNIQHGIVTQEHTYDSINKNYIVMPVGFGGSDFDFVIEVPYEIREYSQKIEIYMYRVYVESKLDLQDNVENIRDNIYYDIDKKDKALDIESGTLSYEADQASIISDYISLGKLEKNKLFRIKYELNKKDEKYILSGYEEIK